MCGLMSEIYMHQWYNDGHGIRFIPVLAQSPLQEVVLCDEVSVNTEEGGGGRRGGEKKETILSLWYNGR